MPDAAEMWARYQPLENHAVTDRYQLAPEWIRRTDAGDLVIPIVDRLLSAPCNLMVCRADGRYRYLHDIRPGEYTPCSDYLDADRCIVGESYISSLALVVEYPESYIVCAHTDSNIGPVISSLAARWPRMKYIAAPDTERIDVPKYATVIRAPGDSSWLDLHLWGIAMREVA